MESPKIQSAEIELIWANIEILPFLKVLYISSYFSLLLLKRTKMKLHPYVPYLHQKNS